LNARFLSRIDNFVSPLDDRYHLVFNKPGPLLTLPKKMGLFISTSKGEGHKDS